MRKRARVAVVRSTPINGALATALGTDDPREVEEVVAALAALARRLSPDLLARLRPGRTTR